MCNYYVSTVFNSFLVFRGHQSIYVPSYTHGANTIVYARIRVTVHVYTFKHMGIHAAVRESVCALGKFLTVGEYRGVVVGPPPGEVFYIKITTNSIDLKF